MTLSRLIPTKVRRWLASVGSNGMRATSIITTFVVAFTCVGCIATRTLSDQDLRAVRAAEAFVLANGYTSEPPSLPFDQLTPERWDNLMSKEQVLAYRHDYLEPQAFGFIRNDDGWLVVFKATDHAVSTRQDAFPFSPVGLYVPVNKKFKVLPPTHAWVDLSDLEIVHLRGSKQDGESRN